MPKTKRLRDLIIETNKRVDKLLQLTAEDTVIKLKASSPVDTGLFRDSWQIEKTKNGYSITNSAPYAEYLQDNPSPGWIETIAVEIPFRLDKNRKQLK